MENRLKIAVQKSGRLQEESLQLLKECGIRIDNGKDQLKASARNYPADILFLRNSDIPQYLEDGVAHIAVIGQNTLVEKQKDVEETLLLGFSRCRLSIAVPKGTPYDGVQFLQGKKIATSYPNSLALFLQANNLQAEIHEISGSVEIAPNIGLADAICDLVSTGSTLFQNGLEEKEVLLRSEACIAASRRIPDNVKPLFEKLVFRIKSVLAARSHKYLLMNAPNECLERIIEILPGMKSPTVMPLATEGWSSVHTVITEDRFWEIIEQLKENGAQGILVVPIEKMIL
ncbi:MAG: ATP phosphoribosyltransferase [Lewinellaceae bacterium]|nr:ATP phosphoribosyltransferase [Lewinella sp.]MCB9277860.1 ATP phosphoribosyltransferase [Lewinellaceae bacterium]